MKVGILQLNLTVGDLQGNTIKIIESYHNAVKRGAELVVATELAITGYPPKDMLLNSQLIERQLDRLGHIAGNTEGRPGLIIGYAEKNPGKGKPLFNTAGLLNGFNIDFFRQRKALLPDYDVFDERRYFAENPDPLPSLVNYRGKRLGILVCEDGWSDTENQNGRLLYSRDPVRELANVRPDAIIAINASPYWWGKGDLRFRLYGNIAKQAGCPVVYANQVGGNDDLIFDGRSFAVNAQGDCIGAAKAFSEEMLIVDLETDQLVQYPPDKDSLPDLRRALVLGTRDYVRKTGFGKVIIGLSGGVDSAVVASIAVEAVEAENVTGLGMPSKYSSTSSVDDARELAKNLGIDFPIVSIETAYEAFGKMLEPKIGWYEAGARQGDVTEENIQARLRGIILMAYSNRLGSLVLTTGNKSEISVGYCTLYGDMVGGFGVISDVPKTVVYRLAKYLGTIPENTISKAPSAELRPGQTDQDTLPPYPILDRIIVEYVERRQSVEKIIAMKFCDPAVVNWTVNRINRNEFKRQQMAPGLKVTEQAYGFGRRWPIAAKF
jgi:NAD+ synthetase